MSPGSTLVKKNTTADTTSNVPTAVTRRCAMSLRITVSVESSSSRAGNATRAAPRSGRPGCESALAPCALVALQMRQVELDELDRRLVARAVRALRRDDALEHRDDLAARQAQHLLRLLVDLAAGRRVH